MVNMNAKEASKKAKAVTQRQDKLARDKAEREYQEVRASALKQLPNVLKRVFNRIEQAANSGNTYIRETYYNGVLASLVAKELRSKGYKVDESSNGGYDYDGGYIGATTEWDLSIRW